MKKITSKKLRNYGAMSAAILAGANAFGQVVYTDIDDVTLVPGDEGFLIDLNDDGTTDFEIENFPAAGAVIFPGINGSANSNAFVGFQSGNFEYPSNLVAGDVIDATSPTTPAGERGDLNFYGCAYTNSQFCDGVVDGFIGLIFQFNGNTHYGWARVDVAADVSEYTLRDFAFDATPDAPIVAGDNALSLADNVIEGLSTYVSNNVLTIDARQPLEAVTIHNVSGQVVISQKLSNTTESVNLSALSTGMYIATIETEGKVKAIKFVK